MKHRGFAMVMALIMGAFSFLTAPPAGADGTSWTLRSTPADSEWTAITYGNGLFVAVASSGTGNRVMTSPDGINWTLRATPADNRWRRLVFGDHLFVAVAVEGTGGRVMTSGVLGGPTTTVVPTTVTPPATLPETGARTTNALGFALVLVALGLVVSARRGLRNRH